jgi:hypothetical protein
MYAFSLGIGIEIRECQLFGRPRNSALEINRNAK